MRETEQFWGTSVTFAGAGKRGDEEFNKREALLSNMEHRNSREDIQ